jgi:UDP-N-acetyl-D-mannosaminuronic acid transferase (WecB/TagA/CpsF family)
VNVPVITSAVVAKSCTAVEIVDVRPSKMAATITSAATPAERAKRTTTMAVCSINRSEPVGEIVRMINSCCTTTPDGHSGDGTPG